MRERKRIITFSAVIGVVVILVCILAFCNTGEKDKSPNVNREKNVSEETTTMDNGVSTQEPTVLGGSEDSEEVTTTNKHTSTDEIVNSDESTGVKETANSDKTTSSKETTTLNKTTSSKETMSSEETTSSKETTTSKKPIIQEEETTGNRKFNITLNVPEIVLVGDSFEVSFDATNCAHIEWYINGEYDSSLEKKINPKGTMKFSKAGIYRITVIGYTEDWSKNVSATRSVRVYNDLSQANGNAKEHDRAMYSWDHDFIYLPDEPMLQKVMELTQCNILYQEVSSNASAKDVAAFLQRRGEHNQTVYYLCGNASWAIEKGATSMLKEVERAASYNKAAGEYKFVGIQFDVEPYCLEDFEENADKYMAQYVENSKAAYKAAHEAGLLVEICIPYWWESAYGYYDELEDLIANACDSVAVMNYYKKGTEASHIETEVELCQKYNKRIINITETIPPGLHGLTENNTYYHDGIDAIEEMWNTLDGYFQYDKLGYSFHWMEVIIELLGLG